MSIFAQVFELGGKNFDSHREFNPRRAAKLSFSIRWAQSELSRKFICELIFVSRLTKSCFAARTENIYYFVNFEQKKLFEIAVSNEIRLNAMKSPVKLPDLTF